MAKQNHTNMKFRLLFTISLLFCLGFTGQSQVRTISLKKGEALDLLLFTNHSDASELKTEYFSKAVSIARQYGYTPQYSSAIKEPPLQGNYWPDVFIMATWKSYDERVKFTREIVLAYPEFHEMRRAIWPTFFLTYWKVETDKSVEIHPDRHYIATAYWSQEKELFDSFQQQWQTTLSDHGGQVVLRLANGTSPFGYHYNPDLFTITEWDSQEAFEKFCLENEQMDRSGVLHVNQFLIQ